jgi:predicted membrane protein
MCYSLFDSPMVVLFLGVFESASWPLIVLVIVTSTI